MTELFATKAIVKLPKKSSNNNKSNNLLVLGATTRYANYLVTDKLYFESMNVTETEIMDLVRSCDPIKYVISN